MMDNGQPDHKRPRTSLTGWPVSTSAPPHQQSRELPLPLGTSPIASYHHGGAQLPRPEPQSHSIDPHRRHSEHAQYEDPRRPTSGHAHAYPSPHSVLHPPFNAPRDTRDNNMMVVKRDPSDEPPTPFKAPSTGIGPDHNVSAPHSERYPPPYDHAQSGPGSYRPSYAASQSPIGSDSYNQYNNHGLPPPREQYSVSYPLSAAAVANSQKRKAQRAAQACDSCRTLKAKCDEGRPQCSSCKEKNAVCVYRDPPPKQVDKTSADILEGLQKMQGSFDILANTMNTLVGKVDRLEREITMAKTPMSEPKLKPKPEPSEDVHMQEYSQPPITSESASHIPRPESPYPSTPNVPRPPERLGEQEVPSDEEAGDPVPPGKPSIPFNHTTGASRLLLVGPIAKLASGVIADKRIKNEKYPFLQENRRGLLRLFGRGEGLDRPPGYDRDPLTDYSNENTPSDTTSEGSSPPADRWGQLGGLRMTPPPDENAPPANSQIGLSSESMPDFSRETVERNLKSYLLNVNNMHPILVPRRLRALVENFLKSIPSSQARPRQPEHVPSYISTTHSSVAGFISSRNPESPGQKRKRSPASLTEEGPDAHNMWGYKPGHPSRSISTALVLLVMALGEICSHTAKIPDIYYDGAEDKQHDSPNIRNGNPRSPMQQSPTLATPIGLPSPLEGNRILPGSRRTSFEGNFASSHESKRNIDRLPGLAYFALATDIIGNQLAGRSLQHVHVNILAGLYHGQLGRIMESHAYINAACVSLQHILMPKLERLQELKRKNIFIPGKDNPLVFAFWTCLQLESDILAELPYTHSGILTLEEGMPPPNLQAAKDEDGFEELILESYSAQLYLRKHLNKLHNMFYNPEDSQVNRSNDHFTTIEACEEGLSSIRKLFMSMEWEEDDPPATDILRARLRAKFYGARVITYRDFVLKILEHSAASSKYRGEQISNNFIRDVAVPRLNAGAQEIDPKIIAYAERGINALIKSTTAFHGLGNPAHQRLRVTNIWGTAHAQWGNVLTLCACYLDPILKRFVDERVLNDLLKKTLEVLGLHMHRSSALSIDYRILYHVGREIGMIDRNIHISPNSSFGGSNS